MDQAGSPTDFKDHKDSGLSREEGIKPADTGQNSHSLQHYNTKQRQPKTRALRETTVRRSDEIDKNDKRIGLGTRPKETNNRQVPRLFKSFKQTRLEEKKAHAQLNAMKTLPIFLAFVMSSLTACDNNYQSVLQAEKACEDWARQGVAFTLEPSGYLESIEYKGATTNRFCEKKEIQYIGYEFDLPDHDKPVFADELMRLRGDAKLTQKFRW